MIIAARTLLAASPGAASLFAQQKFEAADAQVIPKMPAAQAEGAKAGASDPSGSFTIFEAIEKQPGLKLKIQKRAESVVAIDHLEEKRPKIKRFSVEIRPRCRAGGVIKSEL